MKFSNKILSQTVTQLCLIKGIDHIVISPGSRNAPLSIGFTSHPSFFNFSVVDERCAAFFALGIAQQLNRPVALVCTSGSALLNYYPAIAEAYYSDIPLVVISADRPSEYIEIGDGQTIKQENVYANHILYSANTKEGKSHQLYNETEINIALNTAIELQGPVHINIPFSEPLYETVTEPTVRPQHVPARMASFSSEVISEEIKPLITHWNTASKKLILVGVLPPNSVEQRYLDVLGKDPSVIVMTETTSNLHHESFFPAIDQLIAPLSSVEFEELRPEILLTFGGMIVSKKIKAFLRNYKPKTHWHIDAKKAYDTYFILDKHLRCGINQFLRTFTSEVSLTPSLYQEHWLKVRDRRVSKHADYIKQIQFSDFKVFSMICEALPKQTDVQLSNSTVIRYAQLFDFHESNAIFCNRGTSGIDGSMSTAIGAAVASGKPTVFITGDLSFLYDSNALWNNALPNNFKIVLINNGGGGIFRILPKAKEIDHFETFFETRHGLTAKHLCEMYRVEYSSATDETSLKKALRELFDKNDEPSLLEVFTPSEVNDKILLDYFKFIK